VDDRRDIVCHAVGLLDGNLTGCFRTALRHRAAQGLFAACLDDGQGILGALADQLTLVLGDGSRIWMVILFACGLSQQTNGMPSCMSFATK